MSPDPSPLSPPDTGDQGSDILSLRDFRLRFRGQLVPTVNGIDLTVAAGEILCIVGESGCGKSVTAMSIMGLLPPKSSDVLSGSLAFLGSFPVSGGF